MVELYKLKKDTSAQYYNIPLYLETSVDEMGGMVGFDGNIEQVEKLIDFTYSGSTGSTEITIYSSAYPDVFRSIIGEELRCQFGNCYSGLSINSGVTGTPFPSVSHDFKEPGTYEVSVILETSYTTQKLSKEITVPFRNPNEITNPLGSFTTIAIDAYDNLTGQSQNYLNDLDFTNNTGYTTFSYVSFGQSRIEERRLYGSNIYTGVTYGSTEDGITWSGYTIDGHCYTDYSDGLTVITGSTVGFTREDVFDKLITRNEHFIGFIDEPTVYSDIFVERGKQGVMEKNFRLGEIDSIGEIENYGNGYFNVKKQ